MTLAKNDNGLFIENSDIFITSAYSKETKKHSFVLSKEGCAPVLHEGNHLTLRNNLTKLVSQLESTFVSPEGEVTSESATEAVCDEIIAPVEFVETTIDETAPTSESEDYNLFKEYLKKFSEATGEDREAFAEIASQILLGMNIQAV